jgi:Protein of unknown function (DUF2510)
MGDRMSVAPGWHPDPSNPAGAVRWWDGSAWTNHTQPVMAAGSTVAGSSVAGSLAGSGVPASGMPAANLPPAAPAWSPGASAAPAWSPGAPAAPAYYPTQTAPSQLSFAKRNSASLTAMGVVALYVLIAVATHVVLLGIFPVLLAVRATKSKEQLAPLAVVAAVIAVAVAFFALK